VDLALPEVAGQFAAAAERALAGLGGTEAARRAEADPALRQGEVKAALDALGLADLDPRADLESAAMAAEVVRVGGRFVVPFPIVAYAMARPGDGVAVALASSVGEARVDHGDLFEHWVLHDFAGGATGAVVAGPPLASRLAPFVCALAKEGTPTASPPGELELLCLLSASYLLGVAEYALELAIAHVKGRIQFGRPLAELQSVRFQIADAMVAVDGLRELVHFTLWRVASDPAGATPDALAARFSAQEVAQPVLRVAQQLHGASGLCDEYDISVLVRHVQPALRLPLDADAMSDLVFDAISTQGFATLFPLGTGGGQ
jgi:Acyl-CoA dehydrogenase, C-terminal domain